MFAAGSLPRTPQGELTMLLLTPSCIGGLGGEGMGGKDRKGEERGQAGRGGGEVLPLPCWPAPGEGSARNGLPLLGSSLRLPEKLNLHISKIIL